MDLKTALALGLVLAACSHKRGDPPPPASSVNLPVAPPGATGASAAGREPAVAATPGVPEPEDEGDELPPGHPVLPPGQPTLPGPESGGDDAGVAL